MANEVLLQEGHPVDENLRPFKVNGKSTAIETAQSGNGARITGKLELTNDLAVAGDTTCKSLTTNSIESSQLDMNASVVLPSNAKIIFGDTGEYIVGEGSDLDIFSSNDATINAAGTIILDSADGTFEMHGAGATAKFADMYAGMILGYTDIGLNESHTSLDLTTSYVVPTDEFSVSFVAPPSGNVMIDFQIQYYMGSTGAGTLHAGLSTANATSGYAALQSYHEQVFDDTGARNAVTIVHGSWTVTGLTAGAATEYWIGFKTISTAGTTARIQWGGNAANRYPDFIMKATALPASITT